MEFGLFILGFGIGIAIPYATRALVKWIKNNPKKSNNDASE